MKMDKIFHGDCLDELKKLPDNSVDLLCTDPPYGYSFMGKDWDKAVPSVETWKECLRVLKPGAFAFVMSAPRSDVCARMMLRLEDAGFRIDFTPIYWTYASGFPKAMNIGKMVDKRLGAEREVIGVDTTKLRPNRKTEKEGGTRVLAGGLAADNGATITRASSLQAKALEGSYGGFQPKPAVEVIIVAMKPLSEKTFVDQALKNGKGITWLDDCRIPTEGDLQGSGLHEKICMCGPKPTQSSAKIAAYINNQDAEENAPFSAPANVATRASEKTRGTSRGDTASTPTGCSASMLTESTDTSLNISGSGKRKTGQSPKATKSTTSTETGPTTDSEICNVCQGSLTANGTRQARFPANLLVSGDVLNDGKTTKSVRSKRGDGIGIGYHGSNNEWDTERGFADTGSYSRYFDLDAWAKTLPFLIVPKAAKSEKNAGLESLSKKAKAEDFSTAAHDNLNARCAQCNDRHYDCNGKCSCGANEWTRNQMANHHPTVKPLKLMSYLITLGSREGDVVLDPFLGSGTTALASKNLNRRYIGIEREKEYVAIAKARLDNAAPVQASLIAAE